jgi:hypothetical protein
MVVAGATRKAQSPSVLHGRQALLDLLAEKAIVGHVFLNYMRQLPQWSGCAE